MGIREAIVEEALSWQGTPYSDRNGLKGFGVDCAFLPFKVYQNVGLIPATDVIPKYSPQQWLNKPGMSMRDVADTTYLDHVLKYAREITEAEVLPGDLALYKVINSWTHGGIVIRYPDYILHPVIDRGVIGSHATKEGFLRGRKQRFFSLVSE